MEEHIKFKRIIQYCQMMGYNVNDILNMTNHELRLWYERVVKMTEDEINFRIHTGRLME